MATRAAFADSCQGGACVAGPFLDCDDSNPCTEDSCDRSIGCAHLDRVSQDGDGDGFDDAVEASTGCSPNDLTEIPSQGVAFAGASPGGVGEILLTYAAPRSANVAVADDPSCASAGVCGLNGFCEAGRMADPCHTNDDCNQAEDTCRLVVNSANLADLAIASVVLNGEPFAGFSLPTPGCSRKVNVHVVHGAVNRLKLRAAGTVNGARRSDFDAFIYR
jgi:hypothetical protein